MASTFRFVWDGNVLLHETFKKDNSENTELTTWVFEGFVPTAKLVNGKAYSIISDHLGTPILAVDSEGNEVWNRQLDIYGRVKREIKASSLGDDVRPFIPFLYQGQYYDFETKLAYNRFRYYSPETGGYISQDPIRLAGGTNLYSYIHDVNMWLDVFGLESNYLYRGDDNYDGGDVGIPLGKSAAIETTWEHVKFGDNPSHKDSKFKSYSENMQIAKGFTKKEGMVTKVSKETLKQLEAEGKIKIYTPEKVVEMMKNSNDKDLMKEANNVKEIMNKNKEILVEGTIEKKNIKKCNFSK